MGREAYYAGIGQVMCDKASPYLKKGESVPPDYVDPCQGYCGRCPVRVAPVRDEAPSTTRIEETVSHPAHYGGADNPYEHIKVAQAWGLTYELGCATKYICRAGKKDPAKTIEDLRKAAFYLNAEIERRIKEQSQ